jgi:hypothetical protein
MATNSRNGAGRTTPTAKPGMNQIASLDDDQRTAPGSPILTSWTIQDQRTQTQSGKNPYAND